MSRQAALRVLLLCPSVGPLPYRLVPGKGATDQHWCERSPRRQWPLCWFSVHRVITVRVKVKVRIWVARTAA